MVQGVSNNVKKGSGRQAPLLGTRGTVTDVPAEPRQVVVQGKVGETEEPTIGKWGL